MRIPAKSILIGGLPSFAFAVLFATFSGKALRGIYEHWEYLQDRALFWQFLAYCAGTGGSVLIIGSAAGVAIMGILKIDFIWYVRNISILALMG